MAEIICRQFTERDVNVTLYLLMYLVCLFCRATDDPAIYERIFSMTLTIHYSVQGYTLLREHSRALPPAPLIFYSARRTKLIQN